MLSRNTCERIHGMEVDGSGVIHLVLFSERKCNLWCRRMHLDVTVKGNEIRVRSLTEGLWS